MNSSAIKSLLHALCISFVQKRIEAAQQAMQAAQAAANSEEKSSAGDKYETGRAMAQIARDQAAQQLDEALKLKAVLDQIEPKLSSKKVGLGSVVITDKNRFYISISAGELVAEGEKYYAISTLSPIGKLLLSRKENDMISFLKQEHQVLKVF